MTKNELIEELQKIKGNPTVAIGVKQVWGRECFTLTSITPLYRHDGHKVDIEPCIIEITHDKVKPYVD